MVATVNSVVGGGAVAILVGPPCWMPHWALRPWRRDRSRYEEVLFPSPEPSP